MAATAMARGLLRLSLDTGTLAMVMDMDMDTAMDTATDTAMATTARDLLMPSPDMVTATDTLATDTAMATATTDKKERGFTPVRMQEFSEKYLAVEFSKLPGFHQSNDK